MCRSADVAQHASSWSVVHLSVLLVVYFFFFFLCYFYLFFFFNDTATTEIYTLSLHDALPIFKTACTIQIAGRQYLVESYVNAEATSQIENLFRQAEQDAEDARLEAEHINSQLVVSIEQANVMEIGRAHV